MHESKIDRTRAQRVHLFTSAWIVVIVSTVLACGGQNSTLVEKDYDGVWKDMTMEVSSAEGARDGDKISAQIRFDGIHGRILHLELLVKVDPEAKLQTCRWRFQGPEGVEKGGVALAEDLRFLGGQGGRPSLGGLLTLMVEDVPRFRVRFAPVELGSGR